MTEKKKTPEVIEDKDLDEASGGIGLLLPAVQKVRDAANTTGSATPATAQIDIKNIKSADGSV